MQLKRVEVIADDESEIVEAVRRMSDKYDFVVTSGGIGPTLVKSFHFIYYLFPFYPFYPGYWADRVDCYVY